MIKKLNSFTTAGCHSLRHGRPQRPDSHNSWLCAGRHGGRRPGGLPGGPQVQGQLL